MHKRDEEYQYRRKDTTTDLLKALNEIDTTEKDRHSHHDIATGCFKDVT